MAAMTAHRATTRCRRVGLWASERGAELIEFALVFPTLLAICLLLSAWVCSNVVYDGESTWEEGAILIGLYVVIASSFWWGA